MQRILILLMCMACAGHGRRLQISEDDHRQMSDPSLPQQAMLVQEPIEVKEARPASLVEVSRPRRGKHDASDIDASLEHFDKLLDELSDPAAIEEELAAVCQEGHPGYESAELQWRLALARIHVADTKPEDATFREQSLRAGVVAAERAVELDPECGMAHKMKAMTIGLLDPFVGNKERIENAHIIKKHGDIAASKLPDDAEVQLILSGFCMGVAGLSWFERTFGSVVFGALPEATFEEALGYALRACEIMEMNDEKGDTKHGLTVRAVLDVAKCYQALGRTKEAKQWYEKTLNTPVRSAICRSQQEEARKKLAR